jgi:hypothetical protein
MRRSIGWLIAIVLHVAAPLVAALGFAFAEAELPPQSLRRTICVFPIEQLNPLSLAQGATEAEADALFGVSSTPAPRPEQAWCVRYQYSSSLSYTLLFRRRTVHSIWLTEGAFVPYSCEGILVKTVGVAARSWYPSEVPRHASACGCSAADLSPCGGP